MYGEYVVIPAGHTPHKSKSGILIGGEYIIHVTRQAYQDRGVTCNERV